MSAAVVCALATGVLVVAELRGGPQVLKALSKTCASLAFVVAALQFGALGAGVVGLGLLAALALSVVGDLLLLSHDRRAFLGGLGAFLLAHLAYLATFLLLGVAPLPTAAAAVGVGAVCFAVWRWLGPHVGTMRGPVMAYVLAIGAMVSASVGVAASRPAGAGTSVAVAAVVFLLSDLCVARDRFVAPGPKNRLLGLPLYYGAQLLFAWAVPAVPT